MNLEKEIQSLATKAEEVKDSTDALRFSQAAQNLANAANTVSCTRVQDEYK